MNVITKLAINRTTSKKARSGVICAAIFLTMVLFMILLILEFKFVERGVHYEN